MKTPSSHDEMPAFTRRRAWAISLGSMALCLALVAADWRGLWRSLPGPLPMMLRVAPMVVGIGTVPVFIFWTRRLSARARREQGRVCWECGYVLTGLGDAGDCPECGTRYDVANLRRQWQVGGPDVPDRHT